MPQNLLWARRLAGRESSLSSGGRAWNRPIRTLPSPAPAPALPARLAWATGAILLLAAAAIVWRGCGYRAAIPLAYLGYCVLQIVVPGCVALYLAGVRPLTPSLLVAVGIPTGFALEIFSFLGLSGLHASALFPLLPLAWLAVGGTRWWLGRDLEVRCDVRGLAPIAAVLSGLFLCTVVFAAGHLYAEAPLIGGLPQRPIFHDWVYLLSRAAAIKHVWPLEDPSLSGTPLQYHYFMLVHVASASTSTGIDLTWILLRLAVIPLGLALVAQAYALGTRLAHDRWGGVAAAALLLLPGELSAAGDYRQLTYLGFFIRWLYISPTFFFGLVFFGALLLALMSPGRAGPSRLVWIALLAAAGTAAKGPVLPVIILALTLWGGWSWIAERKFPRTIALLGAVATAAFLLVYLGTMAAWGDGGAIVHPFRICEITDFWQHHAVPLQRMLKRRLHAPDFGTWLGRAIISAEVLAGTAGIRLLALPHLLRRHPVNRKPAVRWVVSALTASTVFGLGLHLDSDGELYFLFLGMLPLAALAGASLVAFLRWVFQRGHAARSTTPSRRLVRWLGYTALAATTAGLAAQIATTVRCERQGIADWLRFRPDTAINADLLPLYETTHWLRANTEPNAVLISNAFTAANAGLGRGVLADHTTVGVYYYYSALAERRMWVEGPTYLLDQGEARHRLVLASQLFYRGKFLAGPTDDAAPRYLIIDHGLADGATAPAERTVRVFANRRFEVFRLAAGASTLANAR